MDNKDYLDTLLVTGKIDKKYLSNKYYNRLSGCEIDFKRIINLSLKHEDDISDTIRVIDNIIDKSLDKVVMEWAFNEIYRVLKTYDKYFSDITYNIIVRDMKDELETVWIKMKMKDVYELLLPYRVNEFYTSKGYMILNKKLVTLYKCLTCNNTGEYFTIDNDTFNIYSMIIDYDGECLMYTSEMVTDRDKIEEIIQGLDKEKINIIIKFKDMNGKSLKNILRNSAI